MKKKILIIAEYMRFPWENTNSRFVYLANLIDKEKYDVEIITSTFMHGLKQQRTLNEEEAKKYDSKTTTIYEPGYKKNVSLRRFYSHYILGKNLKKYLNSMEQKPDIIYCAIPSLDVGKAASEYAKKNNIRFIIDLQDLWPEAFKMVLNIPIISNIVFYPMLRTANKIYSRADDIVAVSDTYVERAARVNKKYQNKVSAFLGTELEFFDNCKKENKVEYNDDYIRIAYIGTLGTSYDLNTTIDAIKILKDKGVNNIKFIVMGNGPLREKFTQHAMESGIDYEFTGRLDYPIMVGRLCACDIAVNPIVGASVASIINKVGDYAAAGLPVINTQNSDEYRELLEKYNAGYNCENGNAQDMAEKIEKLIEDKELRVSMGKNNRKFAEDKFDRKNSYARIYKLVDNYDSKD